MSSEEIPPAPPPPDGEDCALLHSFLLSPPQPLRWVAAGAPNFLPEENEKTGRARSKRVKEVGTRRTGARLNDRRSRNDFPRDFRLSGGLSDDESTSFSFRWRYPGGGIGLMLALSVWPSARQLPQRGSQVGAAVCPHHFQRGQSVCSADPLASPFGRGGTAKP